MHTFRSRRTFALPAVALVAAVALTACSGSDDADEKPKAPAASATAGEQTEGNATEKPHLATIDVTVKGDSITPNAQELTVKTGELITMTFDADRAGELHVHSKPEQYIEFEAGQSTQTFTITTPGVVEIEEHDSGVAVAVVTVN